MGLSFVVTTVVSFLGWAAAAALSDFMGDAMTLNSSIWLATGVSFGALLVVASPKRPAVLLGTALAAIAMGLLDGGLKLVPAVAFGVNEAFSVALGAWLARAVSSQHAGDGLQGPGMAYVGLLLGAVLTSVLAASVGIALSSWALPQTTQLAAEWRVWASTTFVGILLAGPLITAYAGFRVKRSGGMGRAQFLAGAASFVLFLVVAALIFSSDVSDRFGESLGPTLTYLPLPFIVVTAILWKERGATLATLLGALALVVWTHAGGGPFSEIEAFPGENVIEVQAYVAVMALLVGVVNALGATAAQALSQAQEWRTRYSQVLESNRTVVASFDAINGIAHWGEGAGELLRTPPAALRTVHDLIAHADSLQQAVLQAEWRDLTQGQRAHALWKANFRWSDGRVASVSARLSGVRGGDGRVEQVAALLEVEV